jgi:cell division protein FtsN
LNRLAADAPADGQRQSDIDGAAKKVSTIPIVVNRDGSLTPQTPQAASSGETSGVPGLVLDGFGPPPVPASAPQLRSDGGPVAVPAAPATRLPPPPPAPAAPKAAQAAPAAPKVADLPLPKVIQPPAATAAVEKRAAPPKKQKAAARDDLVAQQSAGAAASEDGPSGLGSAAATSARRPIAAASSSGYVAVLASKKTRQEALNSFADLHSQYPDVLAGLTPDVREANLGEKGMWYRLIVGPPGSREAARSVCVKLKEKGMNDCWPVAY